MGDACFYYLENCRLTVVELDTRLSHFRGVEIETEIEIVIGLYTDCTRMCGRSEKEAGYEDSYLSCNSGRPAKKHWRRNRLQLRKFAPDTSRIHFEPRETVVVSVGRKPCHEEDCRGGREPGVTQFGVIPAVEKHALYCVQVHPIKVNNLMFCKKEDGRRRRGEKKVGAIGAVAQIAQL
ncbi:hypothetical protein BSKO_00718 [Bryopsis sp. KO-2023]|nr:hypothetical protein BSKO_00718 [Bryopsis sp. KO-2023]